MLLSLNNSAQQTQKYVPCSKNLFNFVYDYKATLHLSDDKLEKKNLSYVWVDTILSEQYDMFFLGN